MPSPLEHLSSVDRVLFQKYSYGRKRSVKLPVIHHAIERQAQLRPYAIAVEHNEFNHSLSYAQLDAHANRLARRLRAVHIVPGHRVCILARRSIYLVTAILAVLKSGAQYIPLDAVTITDATLEYVLNDAQPSMVLVMAEYAHKLSPATPTIRLEPTIDEDERMDADASKPEDLSSPDDGAYIIYTSGTTGVPKGVDVRHRGVSNVISGSPGNVGMQPGMRVAQLLNIAFDMGAWEILGALYNGCTLCIRGNTSREWVALMKTVDIVIATPSVLAYHDPAQYPNIRHVTVGGEPCPQALADNWAQITQFNNCCGPTEISIANTVQPHATGYPLSIGKPIPNTNVYILEHESLSSTPSLDSHPPALPIGEVGAMWVGGIGVSVGYVNLPDKTVERYRRDPFVSDPNAMMFNTGDLGRWRADGQLDHLGRADDQVKVKGFRVELDGVSAAMRTHSSVQSAVALLVGTELWGFATPASLDLSAVRGATAAMQPYYAVPSQYLALDTLPLTRNGKVDKRALAQLAESARTGEGGSRSVPLRSLSLPSPQGKTQAKEKKEREKPQQRLSVQNGGVPFSASLPGTPMILHEQSETAWACSAPSSSSGSSSPSPSSLSSLSERSLLESESSLEPDLLELEPGKEEPDAPHAREEEDYFLDVDTAKPDREQFALPDIPRMVFVDAV